MKLYFKLRSILGRLIKEKEEVDSKIRELLSEPLTENWTQEHIKNTRISELNIRFVALFNEMFRIHCNIKMLLSKNTTG